MQDTGLSLFHEAYRHGGGGQRGVMAFGGKSQGTEPPRCDAEDRQEIMSAWADHPHYDEYWCARCSHILLPPAQNAVCLLGYVLYPVPMFTPSGGTDATVVDVHVGPGRTQLSTSRR